MSKGTSAKSVFRELETHNPSVAKAFRSFRRQALPPDRSHAGRPERATLDEYGRLRDQSRERRYEDYNNGYAAPSMRLPSPSMRSYRRSIVIWPQLAVALLLIGIIAVAIVIGHAVLAFLAVHWQSILLPVGGVCLGAGAVLLALRVGKSPLRAVAPPNVKSQDPLQELKSLAERTASRLRTAYSLQLWAVIIVGAIFILLIVWSIVMVSQQRLLYASAFGSGSVAMLILTQWKWQPFDRINEARKLADNADTTATGLRLRMTTISEITDPSVREKAQWAAVREYLEHS
jgi:uncharacterized integral membrane protein